MKQTSKIKDFTVTTVELRKGIKLDAKIPEKVFHFEPPKGVKLWENEGEE